LGGIEVFHRILVCLDHSKLDEQVLPYASAEAVNFGSKIVLLHVCKKDFKSFDLPPSGQFSFVPIELVLREFSQRWNESALYLRRIASRLACERIDAEPMVIEGIGTIAESIKMYAEANAIDLIAMASRGRRGLKRLVFGSVASSVATMTAIPVLLVKHESAAVIRQHGPISAGEVPDLDGSAPHSAWREELDPRSVAA
jgi:nucleotide-binding universal stress UspA family protein